MTATSVKGTVMMAPGVIRALAQGAQKTWGEPRRNRALSSNEGKSISY